MSESVHACNIGGLQQRTDDQNSDIPRFIDGADHQNLYCKLQNER